MKIKKYGNCKSILIRKIIGIEQAILIKNAFPTLDKYVKSKHTIGGLEVKISSSLEKDILDDFKYLLSLKKNGLDLFFTDIDKIKEIIKEDTMITV